MTEVEDWTSDDNSGASRFRQGIDKLVLYSLVVAIILLFLLFPLFLLISVAVVGTQACHALLAGVRTKTVDGDPPEITDDAAFPSYLDRLLWPDWEHATGQGLIRARERLDHASESGKLWFSGKSTEHVLLPVHLAYRLGWAITNGIVLLVVAAVTVLIAVIWLVLGGLQWAAVLLLRGVDAAVGRHRRIRTTCPRSSCWKTLGRVEYVCESCDAVHENLRPNRFGILWHVCRQCTRRLPTTVVLGRHRLTARCPHCHRDLPPRTGRVPIEPLPIVGGTGAGKTTYLTLALHELITGAAFNGSTIITDRAQRTDQEGRWRDLEAGDTRPTQPGILPTGVIADIGRKRGGGRILSLFDVAGEMFSSELRTARLGYLGQIRSLLVIVDPSAIPELRELVGTPSADGSAPTEPDEVLRAVLLTITKKRGPLDRIAVVVTKGDLLEHSIAGRPDKSDVRAWLIARGLGAMVNLVEQNARQDVRYAVSDLTVHDTVAARADLLLWLAHEDRSRSSLGRRETGDRLNLGGSNAGDPPLVYRAGRAGMMASFIVGSLAVPVAAAILLTRLALAVF